MEFFWQLVVKNNLGGFLANRKIYSGFAACIKFFSSTVNSNGLGSESD